MKRISVLLVVFLALLGGGCATAPAEREGVIHHIVLLWLKRPGNAADRQALIEASYRLRQIPGVLSVTAGPPVPGAREIVDDSFDVAVTLVFPDRAALEAYLAHPLHRRLVREVLAPRVARIRVHDYRVSPPTQ